MVDWDRVAELRSRGWDWDRIARDPKVGFHADSSTGSPGRTLRALYHRQGSRKVASKAEKPERPGKEGERRWTLVRIGYLALPLVAVWFVLAYVAPSPVGLLVPALPWLALGLAVAAFILGFGLLRTAGAPRWSTIYRNTLVVGVVLGIVVASLTALVGLLAFGCPYLPPASSAQKFGSQGWEKVSVAAWQQNGVPVVYSFGTTWCPFCSASSWAEWKALISYASVSGTQLDYSSATDVYAQTPEMVLAFLHLSSKNGSGPAIDFQVSEDTSGVSTNFPATSSCFQSAYVNAYSGNQIPFVVVNGQYVHVGALVSPNDLKTWAAGANGGAGSVKDSTLNETAVTGGNPWTSIQTGAWWFMAIIAKVLGTPITTLKNEFGWSTNTTQAVTNILPQIP